MKTLRTIVGKTRRDRVRNTDIRYQCRIKDTVRWVRQRKRQWYDHVKRMKRWLEIYLSGIDAEATSELTERQISEKKKNK